MTVPRKQEHDLRTVALREPGFQSFRDPRRREVLVLDVDAVFGGSDHIPEKVLDFLRDLAAVGLGPGARETGWHITGPDRHALGPGFFCRIALSLIEVRQCLAGRISPAECTQLTQLLRGLAADDGLHVMKWAIRFAVGVDPARIIGRMFTAVPAALGQIEPTDEGKFSVDDDELLVMAGTRSVFAVEVKVQSLAVLPAESIGRQQLALQHVHHREVP